MSTPCLPTADDNVGDGLTSQDDEYLAAVAYLFGLINYERTSPASSMSRDFRLDRMRALLEAVGSPQQQLPAIHIAGTKGKGSTAAMLAGMLEVSGLTTGLFTSPHMQRFEERMTVNGNRPAEHEIVSLTNTVRSAADRIAGASRLGSPTFFEVTTAMAWLYFQSRQVELVVLETGLGGRLDATNVCQPILTMITSISRDHVHLLGETLEEIATEKAGIIKPNVPVISGVKDAAAQNVIARIAAGNSAPLIQFGETLHVRNKHQTATSPPRQPGIWTGDIETAVRTHTGISAPLAGAHQLKNAALAVAALDQLQELGIPIDTDAEQAGLNRVDLPVRIEVVRQQPLTIVDSAHNEASISALLETILEIPAKRRHLIFGTSADKDAAAMLGLVAGKFDDVVLTRYASNPRALELQALCDVALANGIHGFSQQTDPESAWEFTHSRAAEDDLICVTGSFFLAAEFRELLRKPS